MSDKQHPDDPRFDWLYSGRRSDQADQADQAGPAGQSRQTGQDASDAPADAEETRVDPATAGSDETRVAPGHDGATADPARTPDDTRPLPISPGSPPEATRQLPTSPAPGADSPQRPASFGGTYGPPPPRRAASQQGFAPPSGPPSNPGGVSAPPRGPAPTPAAKPPRRPRRRRWWLRGIVLALVLWLAFLVAMPLWAYSKISKVDAEPGGARPEDTPGTTYLIVGSDAREGVSGGRTDTIILLHVPDSDGPNLVLSVPRDSFVEIPGQGENKINAAYALGGPELLVQTVESATGVRVDNYVEIGFEGFVDVVDAVGGIEVCPQEPIDDPQAGLQIDEGCQEIDGEQALGYSRSRDFADGDITRAEHQREVISAVGQEAVTWQTFVLPWRYYSLNMAAAETLRIGENVGPVDLARFAWAMANSGGSDAKRCVVPFTDLGASTSAGSAVIWDEQRADAVFDGIRADDTASIECSAR